MQWRFQSVPFSLDHIFTQEKQCVLLFLACTLSFFGLEWSEKHVLILYLNWDRKCSTIKPPSAPLAASISVFSDGFGGLYWADTALRPAPLVCIIRMSAYWHHTAKVYNRVSLWYSFSPEVTKSNFPRSTSCSCAHFGMDKNLWCHLTARMLLDQIPTHIFFSAYSLWSAKD